MAPLLKRLPWLLHSVGLLLLGQLISLLITATGFSSSTLARRGIDAPTAQSFCNYVLIAIIYGGVFLWRKRPPNVPLLYYFILSFIDVEANYIVVKAYQYTSLTSVMLLDCWTIPCVLGLTWFFLKTKYNSGQLIGVGMCVAGLILVVLSDVHSSDHSGGPRPILGDTLVIIGATMYGVCNVSQEFIVKNMEFVEMMTFLGVFGALISACQLMILERQELLTLHWNASAVWPFITYGAALFLFYTLVPCLLKFSGSALLNLSLLTSDMWAVLIRIFVYQELVDWLYFVAFAAVLSGLVVYSSCSDKEASFAKHVEVDNNNEKSEEQISILQEVDEHQANES